MKNFVPEHSTTPQTAKTPKMAILPLFLKVFPQKEEIFTSTRKGIQEKFRRNFSSAENRRFSAEKFPQARRNAPSLKNALIAFISENKMRHAKPIVSVKV